MQPLGVSLRNGLGLSLSESQERALVRLLQLVLLGLAGYGLATGNASVAVNAAGGLAVSALPALLRREVGLRMSADVVLVITVAVLLHAVGILGPYRTVWWYDYLTHALSAAVVTGIGYAVVRSIDTHSESIALPEPFFSVFLFLVVVAFAVLWEVLEFAVGQVSEALGVEAVLIVFGVTDIVGDVVFSALGGLLVVLWGRGTFRPLAAKLSVVFPERRTE